jgi:Major intrinsic protein
MTPGKRAAAEFFGTFWLFFGGCVAAILDAAFPPLGMGFLGVAPALGLTVPTMAFAIGHISDCHPAITLGLVAGDCGVIYATLLGGRDSGVSKGSATAPRTAAAPGSSA